MPEDTAVGYLKSAEEWDLLDCFNPDRVDQAQIYASLGEFPKAASTLNQVVKTPDKIQPYERNYEENVENIKLLHSYLLKVRVQPRTIF